MKLTSFALFAMLATLQAAPVPSQTVERWQAAAVLKYPALKESGSPLNQQFLAIIAGKRQSEPAFFSQPDWPLRAADLAVEALKAAEVAAKEKAKADEAAAIAKNRSNENAARNMSRAKKEQEEKAELAKARAEEAAMWETQKDKWVFDKLMFGDAEDVITRKLAGSKIVTSRVAPSVRVDLNSRYRWVLGERNFNMDFEMKDDKLTSIGFACPPERTTNLDSLVREDWDKVRAVAIERFGQPTKSSEYPTTNTLRRGGTTVTDVWERPGSTVTLGVAEDDSMCKPTLRISTPAKAG